MRRREFISVSGAGMAFAASGFGANKPARLGLIGTGQRGTSLLQIALLLDGVEINALGDIDKAHLGDPRRKAPRTAADKPAGHHAPLGGFPAAPTPVSAPARSSESWAWWGWQRIPEADHETSSFTADKLAHLRGHSI